MDADVYSDDDDSVLGDALPQPDIVAPAQNKSIFDEWLRNHRQTAYRSLRDSDNDDKCPLTPANFVGAKSQPIINSPREYQTELVDIAKEKNIIVVLDTGAGKTLIAALLLRHVVEQELEDRKAGQDPRLAFFLVDKIALVHQQYRVLEANLDFAMDSFTGKSSGIVYTQEFWNQIRRQKTVIVCTADVLYGNLLCAFIRMDQINLLIFDEAHHTKKNHPYARIIRDFYATLEEGDRKRPRILGMTASPVDAKTNVHVAAAKLEGLLHSEITTVRNPNAIAINKPIQAVINYQNMGTPYETDLWQELYRIVGKNSEFARLFAYSKAATTELGRWAADRVWKIWLTKEEADKIEARTERGFSKMTLMQPDALIEAEREAIGAIRRAYQLISDYSFTKPELNQYYLSHKVMKLIEHLRKNFNPESDRYVVFAEQRFTVALLADLIQQPGLNLRGYRTGALMGSASGTSGDLGTTLSEQKSTINKFRSGEINCLFATGAGEEGIDIPDCNVVIRFDLYKTVIQYIQSRGRARKSDSKFYLMMEAANLVHQQLVEDIEDHEKRLREFCSTLPEDRLIAGCDYNIDYHLSQEKIHPVYKVPSTGAMLTYKSSISVLSNFVSSLPRPADAPCYAADYIVHSIGGKYKCQVLLPDSSPIRSAIGESAPSKQVAKCSAAFMMCLKLKQEKHLDDNLQPTFSKRLPAMRNARLAISSKKRSEYHMKTKPDEWSRLGFPERLFMTVVKLSSPQALGRPSRPLGLLTRHPLSQTVKFTLYFGNQQESDVELLHLSTAIDCCPEDINGLNHFTLRIFKDVFSKEYACEAEKMPYFFAPLMHLHDEFKDSSRHLMAGTDARTMIDWGCLLEVQSTPSYLEWENQPEQIFDDKFVVDPYDGSRKFYTIRRRPDLKSTDPQLPGLPTHRQRKGRGEDTPHDIWNSTISLWGKSRSNLVRSENLPVVEAEFIPLRRNLLDKFDVTAEANQRRCYLVFQVLKISALPVDIVAMAYNLPAIIYRLESNLIAMEACKSIGLDLLPELALEAMTKDSDNAEDDPETQVIIQGGMGKNYERLEYLGDSFLKMSTTIALFSQIQDCDEFQYHVDRVTLVCNRNLFNNALDLKLEESIRTKAFDRRTWYPEGLNLLKGKRSNGNPTHAVADKSIADVCEALIGAAYLTTYKQRSFDMAIQAVTKFVNHANHKMTTYSEYYAAYEIPRWQSAAPRAVHCELADEIEKKMGYKFRYPRLLRSAFTHPSYGSIYEEIPNYQRLEFLGDALLDMVCVDYLFNKFPHADPQWLTEHKMAMASNQFLGCLCVSLNLQKHMVSMGGSLHTEIAEYILNLDNARAKAEEEALESGLSREEYARNYWVREKRPPKCLPDIVEAYVGALFVDSEYDYEQVQRFFTRHILPYFGDIHLYDTYANNQPVTLLSNVLATKFRCRRWSICCGETDDENREFCAKRTLGALIIHETVRDSAFSESGRYAKVKVAQKALHWLMEMSLDEFKTTFGCNCS